MTQFTVEQQASKQASQGVFNESSRVKTCSELSQILETVPSPNSNAAYKRLTAHRWRTFEHIQEPNNCDRGQRRMIAGDTWEEVVIHGGSSVPMRPGRGSINPLIVVSSYNDFADLAHNPRGAQAEYSVRTYQLDVQDGSLTLLSLEKGDKNPAFIRMHPKKDVMYICTESLSEHGRVVSYAIDRDTGGLRKLGEQDAQGSSTCYLTIDKAQRFLLIVNYWSSQVLSMPINPETAALESVSSVYHPNGSEAQMKVCFSKHVNHSQNDEDAQKERQQDPHTHAVVLDPYLGCVAYVPDLGMDVIHELFFDRETGRLDWISDIKVGVQGKSHGPRYVEFHQTLPVCYVINEIASAIAVFFVDRAAIENVAVHGVEGKKEPTLKPMQTISTIPRAFPLSLNTCGRITVHPSGHFVLVSNRGHNSLAVFRIKHALGGKLSLVGFYHTRGETPRHFQFDGSGHWLMVANQDTDSLAVFEFNVSDGKLCFTNNIYSCPSPNFVACFLPDHDD